MRQLCRLFILSCFVLYCPIADAADPVVPFLDGLRARGYLDTALEYLDSIDQPGLDPEIQAVLPFQRAVTLLMASGKAPTAEERQRQLAESVQLFAEFIRQQPEHPAFFQARTLLGEAQLQLARLQIDEADQSPRTEEQTEFWRKVRLDVQDIRTVFEQLRQQYQATWEQYPAFLPEDEPELRRYRDRAEEMLIRALLDLAQCDYWEGHTFPVHSPERNSWLTKSGTAYEAIHQRYRSQVGGLYARLWQGKCYEELNDEQGIRLALGIYGEILDHHGISRSMQMLKDQSFQFRLICLNSDFRRDYQLVELEGESWLLSAGMRAETEVGWGISWEICRALEAMSLQPEWASDTQIDFLERARVYAEHLQQVPCTDRVAARRLLDRIDARLGLKTEPPADRPAPPVGD